MRALLIFTLLVVLYYALKTVLSSALRGYREDNRRAAIKGEEMVLDPVCRTYVVKDRAVTKRIRGSDHSFCSEACARRYEEDKQG